jgi:hypothetical protein
MLIEEIITLIDERTKGSLGELLNEKFNYMNFTFDSIQELLAQHTIHFSQGRKSLEKRINRRLMEKESRERVTKKFAFDK